MSAECAAAAAVCCITLHCGWASFLTMIGRKEEELRLRLSRFPLLRRTTTLHTVHCSLLNVCRYMSNIYLFNIFGCCLEVFGTGVKSRQPMVFCYQKFMFVTLNQLTFWQSVLHLPNSIQLNIEYLCWCPKITMSFYVARGKLVGHQQRCFLQVYS